MDPMACLIRYTSALLHRDGAEATDAHNDLRDWLERGGFEPAWGTQGTASRAVFMSHSPRTGRPTFDPDDTMRPFA